MFRLETRPEASEAMRYWSPAIAVALTLAGAVIVSGVIAVTLSPMMCSKLLKAENAHEKAGWLTRNLDRLFEGAGSIALNIGLGRDGIRAARRGPAGMMRFATAHAGTRV